MTITTDKVTLKLFGQEIVLRGAVARKSLPWLALTTVFICAVWMLQGRVVDRLDKLDEHLTKLENRVDHMTLPRLHDYGQAPVKPSILIASAKEKP